MAISFYEKGELSSGFYGWRVAVTIRGKRYQKYFSLSRPNTYIPRELWFSYQETRARYFEARWMARSAAVQYLDFINTEHPTTRPHRGAGFQGITLGIGAARNTSQELCYFSVNKKGATTKFFIDETASLTKAWEQAVAHWGDVFGVRQKDIEKKLRAAPSPGQFKELRKYMNKHEGTDFPAGVLHHVYSEKRSAMQKQKTEQNTERSFRDGDLFAMYANLEREISEYRK